jgi:hypothetical protein
MHPKVTRYVLYTANGFILTGTILLIINFIGLFHYTTIEGDETENISDHPRSVSEQEFWDNAYRRDNESVEEYVDRLTALVEHRMIAIDPSFARPTFFENWILWIRSQRIGHHEWLDTGKAVRLGGGYCSQHAIVLDNLLDEQGIESRILGLSGHVINEVLIDGKWKVYDSNYNVVFNGSLSDLESNPEQVYRTYIDAGYEEGTARNWQAVYGSPENNWHFRNSLAYASEGYFIFEKLALKLIWYIPFFLLISGVLVRLWLAHKKG